MNLLQDVITYVRRIIKSPSNAVITDNLIIDYINRFWIMDVDGRIQLFDLKQKYQFMTVPGVDRYNMPLYNVQPFVGQVTNYSGPVAMFPVYQGFVGPARINGVQVHLQTQKNLFDGWYSNYIQNMQVVGTGNGGAGPYTFNFPIGTGVPQPQNPPFNGIIRGHIDISGIIATGQNVDPPLASNTSMATTLGQIPTTSIDSSVFITSIDAQGKNVVVSDSGIFFNTNINYGMLIQPGNAPFGNSILPVPSVGVDAYSLTSNTINYLTGVANVTFPVSIPSGNNIAVQCYYYQGGLPTSILYYNNVITLRTPPAFQCLVELDAYLSPTAFLTTSAAIPFGYMAEYIARGAARKILSDTGDVEQFMFYEPLFKEQELLVWKRSQRQWTSTRTHSLYSQGNGFGYNGYGGGTL